MPSPSDIDPGRSAVDVGPLREDELPAAFGLRVDAFTARGTATWEDGADDDYVPLRRRVGARLDGRLVGHSAAWDHGQWLGGRRVPMGGVAAVIVAPEARGRGVAGRVLRAVLDRCAADGDVIACLYPTVPSLYRAGGFGVAGVRIEREVDTAVLRDLPRPGRPVELRPTTADDAEAVRRLTAERARGVQGRIDRAPGFAARRLALEDEDRAWIAERDGRAVGYLQVERERPRAGDDSISRLRVTEVEWADRDAWLALWRLVGSHASVAARTAWVSEPHEPLLDVLDLPFHGRTTRELVWMARVLDLPGLVAGRGWTADGTIVLDVADPDREAVAGRWAVRVEGGAGIAERTDAPAELALAVGSLSAVLTGHVRAVDLLRDGRATGDAAAAARLDRLLAGPRPWMRDFF